MLLTEFASSEEHALDVIIITIFFNQPHFSIIWHWIDSRFMQLIPSLRKQGHGFVVVAAWHDTNLTLAGVFR